MAFRNVVDVLESTLAAFVYARDNLRIVIGRVSPQPKKSHRGYAVFRLRIGQGIKEYFGHCCVRRLRSYRFSLESMLADDV